MTTYGWSFDKADHTSKAVATAQALAQADAPDRAKAKRKAAAADAAGRQAPEDKWARSKTGSKIYVGNLVETIDERDLFEYFKTFGKILDVHIIRNEAHCAILPSHEAEAQAQATAVQKSSTCWPHAHEAPFAWHAHGAPFWLTPPIVYKVRSWGLVELQHRNQQPLIPPPLVLTLPFASISAPLPLSISATASCSNAHVKREQGLDTSG
eukprot:TRINITY_DN12004_c1_g1_i5.p1 TRINITY_DN12004_c1_g1~~TRINITY_DN12004_c1_g1_i5.p1  ORF type:complete len:210 (+),score=40.46 TRINITY_DN12004_c1_g1_i5:152-781(+)